MSLEKLTVIQLQQELDNLNLETSGTKAEMIQRIRKSVRGISIWNSPLLVTRYFVYYLISTGTKFVINLNRTFMMLIASMLLIATIIYNHEGYHQPYISSFESALFWYGWWVGLGVASSIGLGTGLHTFVLFLGPLVANATMTAYTCKSLEFHTRGDNPFVCLNPNAKDTITIIGIWSKVYKEVFFWGAGTAIGELPPFFVARAAALAGQEDPEIAAIEKLRKKKKKTMYDSAQIMMQKMVTSLGFWGILILASVPNPLFDLAGIICGRFGVPFTTFFLATFIGKATFKCNIQALSIIILFSRDTISSIRTFLKLHAPDYIYKTIGKMIDGVEKYSEESSLKQNNDLNIFSFLWNMFMIGMILYFLLSTVESLALSHFKQVRKKKQKSQ